MSPDIRIRIRSSIIRIRIERTGIRAIIRIAADDQRKKHTTFFTYLYIIFYFIY